MADERSTELTHAQNPDQREYDWAYYNWIMPHIGGKVLDIGSGNLMFVREYAKKDDVSYVTCLDKFTDNPILDKVTQIQWVCPETVPAYGTYDTVVSTEFVEHITEEHLDSLLADIKTVMDDESLFLGSTPNKLVPTTNPYHLREYTAQELKEKLERHFQDVTVEVLRGDLTVWKASRPR